MNNLNECKVLIVDDTEMNIDVLVEALYEDYDLSVAMDGNRALEIVDLEKPDIILLDIMMPEMDGYEVCKRLKRNKETKDIPVIFLTAITQVEEKAKAFRLGGVDFITKPFEILEVKERVKTHLSLGLAKRELERQNEILEEKVQERTKELLYTRDAIIDVMARMAEDRDPETGGHIKRTKEYVYLLTKQLYLDHKYPEIVTKEYIDIMYKSAPMHDIGKIGISDMILLKPGRLSEEEFETMKLHTKIGNEIISSVKGMLHESVFLDCAGEIALTHQEKWDGSGYPIGLKGKEIPLAGRVMAIADVYDALRSKRPYKDSFSHDKSCEIIQEGKGKHFEPLMVDEFIKLESKFHEISNKYVD